MENRRRKHTPEEKVGILRRHLVEKESVSSLCEEYQIHPTVLYRWLKVFFENGAAAFRAASGRSLGRNADTGPSRACSALVENLS